MIKNNEVQDNEEFELSKGNYGIYETITNEQNAISEARISADDENEELWVQF